MAKESQKKEIPNINDEREMRLKKLRAIERAGIDAYPARVARSHKLAQALEMRHGDRVVVVGRLMSKREMGKLIFCHLQDESARVQVVFKQDELGNDMYKLFEKKIDIADIVQVEGERFVTKKGEESILVKAFTLLTKALLPLPNKFHGLQDIELRYRKRYLDLLIDDQAKARFRVRTAVIETMRQFFIKRDYLEVETPTLQPIYGGGFARPFVTHHNALDSDFYLRISDEMYLKRLIIGGFEKVFEITKVFRNEGIDQSHNPEFTMFEAQVAYEDYNYGMDILEEMFEYIASTVLDTTEFKYDGETISVKRPWQRYTLVGAIKEFTGVDPMEWQNTAQAEVVIAKLGVEKDKLAELHRMHNVGEMTAFVFEELVEEKLIQPTIIYDYPVEVSPLAKKCADPRFAQRFEIFAMGMELGNNYSELNDPVDLRQRFVEEKRKEDAGFDEAHQTDFDYLTAIEHGFPPTCGLGVGVDRFVMLLTNTASIKEVIFFPTLRPEHASQSSTGRSRSTKVAHVIFLDDPNIPEWSKLNTIAHLNAAFGAREGKKLFHTAETKTKKGVTIPMNSQYAIIIKTATESQALWQVKQDAELANMQVEYFIKSMQNTTNDLKVQQLHPMSSEGYTGFLGVLIFGDKKEVERITKGFDLCR